jgi:ubiquinone/menaquinone biosynthesis C-methylase UbiE
MCSTCSSWSCEVLRALRRSDVPLVGGRVLEVGCGSGYFLHRLVEYGAAQAAGIDLMADRLNQARARYPNLELLWAMQATCDTSATMSVRRKIR